MYTWEISKNNGKYELYTKNNQKHLFNRNYDKFSKKAHRILENTFKMQNGATCTYNVSHMPETFPAASNVCGVAWCGWCGVGCGMWCDVEWRGVGEGGLEWGWGGVRVG